MEVKRQGKDFVTTVANPIYDTVFKYLMKASPSRWSPYTFWVIRWVTSRNLWSNPEMRRKMDIEYEMLLPLEKLDTIILQKERQIEVQSLQLEEQNHQLEARNQEILKQKELLRISVRTLLGNGLSEDAVAASLGITPQKIKELLEE